jgi:hypothetical protein
MSWKSGQKVIAFSHGVDRFVVANTASFLNEHEDDMEHAEAEDERAADDMEPHMDRFQNIGQVTQWSVESGEDASAWAVLGAVIGEKGQVGAVEGDHVGVVQKAVDGDQARHGDCKEDEGVDFVEAVKQPPAIPGVLNMLPAKGKLVFRIAIKVFIQGQIILY